MKLHLPSGLRKALLACLAAVALPAASIPTTIASASGIAAVFLIANQRANAEITAGEEITVKNNEEWDQFMTGGKNVEGNTVVINQGESDSFYFNDNTSGDAVVKADVLLKSNIVISNGYSDKGHAYVFNGKFSTDVDATGSDFKMDKEDLTIHHQHWKFTGDMQDWAGNFIVTAGSGGNVLEFSGKNFQSFKGRITLTASGVYGASTLLVDSVTLAASEVTAGALELKGNVTFSGSTITISGETTVNSGALLTLGENTQMTWGGVKASTGEGTYHKLESLTLNGGSSLKLGGANPLSITTLTLNTNADATLGVSGTVKLDIGSIVVSDNHKLTIDLTGLNWQSESEYQLFTGSNTNFTQLVRDGKLTFAGIEEGMKVTLDDQGKLTLSSSTSDVYTWNGTGSLTWDDSTTSAGWSLPQDTAFAMNAQVEFTATGDEHNVTVGSDVNAFSLAVTDAGATYNFTAKESGSYTITLRSYTNDKEGGAGTGKGVTMNFGSGVTLNVTGDFTNHNKSAYTFEEKLTVGGKLQLWGDSGNTYNDSSLLTLKKGGEVGTLDVSWGGRIVLGADLLIEGWVFDGSQGGGHCTWFEKEGGTAGDVYVNVATTVKVAARGGGHPMSFGEGVGLKVSGSGTELTLTGDWTEEWSDSGKAIPLFSGDLRVDRGSTLIVSKDGETDTKLTLTKAINIEGNISLWGGTLTLEKGGSISNMNISWGGNNGSASLVLGGDLEVTGSFSHTDIDGGASLGISQKDQLDEGVNRVYVLFKYGTAQQVTLTDFLKKLEFNSNVTVDTKLGIGKTGTGKLTITDGGTLSRSLKIKQGDMEFQKGMAFSGDVVLAGGNAIFSGGGDNGDETSSNTVTGKFDVTSGSLTLGKASLTLNGGISGSLTDLTLGSKSVLDVKSGTLSLTGKLSFETGSMIKLSTNAQQITLPETALADVSGKTLAIELSSTFIGSQGSGTIKLFSYWKEEWDNLFTFSVAGDSGTYTNIHVDDGNLCWDVVSEPTDNGLYWGKNGGDTNVTLGGDESNEWSDTSDYSVAGSTPWATGKNVYLEAPQGAVDVTVGEGSTMKTLTVGKADGTSKAVYTFSASGTQTLTVSGDLTIYDSSTFEASVTVNADGHTVAVNGGPTAFAGALTADKLTITGSGTVVTLGGTVDVMGSLDLTQDGQKITGFTGEGGIAIGEGATLRLTSDAFSHYAFVDGKGTLEIAVGGNQNASWDNWFGYLFPATAYTQGDHTGIANVKITNSTFLSIERHLSDRVQNIGNLYIDEGSSVKVVVPSDRAKGDLFSAGSGHTLYLAGDGQNSAGALQFEIGQTVAWGITLSKSATVSTNTETTTLTGQLNAATYTLTKKGTGILELGSTFSTAMGNGKIAVTEGTLKLSMGSSTTNANALQSYTVDLSANTTLESGVTGGVLGTLSGTGNLTISAGSLTVSNMAQNAKLQTLTMGGNSLTVSAGNFTIENSWGWTAGAQLTLGTGVQITLGGSLSFAEGVSGGNRLTINLSKAYLDALIGGNDPDTVNFFAGGWKNDQGWENYFTFNVTGDDGTFTDLKLNSEGKLTWTTAEEPSGGDVYWGGGAGETGELTWGGSSGGNFDTDAEGSGNTSWNNDGNTSVTFVADERTPHTVTLGDDIHANDLTVKGDAEGSTGGTYEFTSDNPGTNKWTLDVKGDLTVNGGAQVTFSEDVSLSVAGDVKLDGEGSTLTLNSDMVFGGTLSGGQKSVKNGKTLAIEPHALAEGGSDGAGDTAVYALWDNSETQSVTWSELQEKFGSDVLDDDVDYGVSLSTDLTVSKDATINKAFKVKGGAAKEGEKTLTFSDNVTLQDEGSLVLEDYVTVVLKGTLTGSVNVTHEGSGKGTLEVHVGFLDTFDATEMTFGTGVKLVVKGPETGGEWGWVNNLGELDELELSGDQVVLRGTNVIGTLTLTNVKHVTFDGSDSVSTGNISTTLKSSTEFGDNTLLDLRAGELVIGTGSGETTTTLTLKGGLEGGSGGTIKGANLTFAGTHEDSSTWSGSLALDGALTMSGTGKQTINGTTSMSAGSLTVSNGELVLGGSGITVSGDATLSGGKLTLSGTSSLGTLKKAEGGSGNLEVTSGSLTIGSIEQDASLGTLTLGQGVSLTVGGGTLKGEKLDATNGGSLTLTMTKDGVNLNFLTLTLGNDKKLSITLDGYESWAQGQSEKKYQLFESSTFTQLWNALTGGQEKNWDDFFEFTVDGEVLSGLKLNDDGSLTWTEAVEGDALYWKASSEDSEITLGSGSDKEWSYKDDYSGDKIAWQSEKEIHLATDGVAAVTVTVGDNVKMKSLSFEGAATYTLTGGEAIVEGNLTNSATKVSIGTGVTLDVQGTYTGDGALELAGGKVKLGASSTVKSLSVTGDSELTLAQNSTLTLEAFTGTQNKMLTLNVDGSADTTTTVDLKGTSTEFAGALVLQTGIKPVILKTAGNLKLAMLRTGNWIDFSSSLEIHSAASAGTTATFSIDTTGSENDAMFKKDYQDNDSNSADYWGSLTVGEESKHMNFAVTLGEGKQWNLACGAATIWGDMTINSGRVLFNRTTGNGAAIHGKLSGGGELGMMKTTVTIDGKDGDAGSIGSLNFKWYENGSTLRLGGDLVVGAINYSQESSSGSEDRTKHKIESSTGSQIYVILDKSELTTLSEFVQAYGAVTLGSNVGYGVNVTGTATFSEGGQLDHAFKAKVASSGKLTLSGTTQYNFAHGLMLDGGTVELTCTGGLKVGGAAEGTPFFSWADGTKLTVNASQGITIDLTGLSTLNGGNSTGHELTLNLTSDFLEAASAGQKRFKLFNLGTYGIAGFSKYFKLLVDGKTATGEFTWLELKDAGTLEWGSMPEDAVLYWGASGGDNNVTLGTTEGPGEWSHEKGNSGKEAWEQDKYVVLEAQGGGEVAVTVAADARMANLTLESGATYNFTGEALNVTDTLTANTSATFSVSVSAKKLVVNAADGTVDFSGGLTLNNTGAGLTLEKGSVTFSGGEVSIQLGTTAANDAGIVLKDGTSLTIKDSVTLKSLGYVELGKGAELVFDGRGVGDCAPNNTIVYGTANADGTHNGALVLLNIGTSDAAGKLTDYINILPGKSTSGSWYLGKIVLRDSNLILDVTQEKIHTYVENLVVEDGSTLTVSAWNALRTNADNNHAVHLGGGEEGEQAKLTLSNTEMLWNLVLDDDATVTAASTGGFFKGKLTAATHTLTVGTGNTLLQLRDTFTTGDSDTGVIDLTAGVLELDYADEEQTSGNSAEELKGYGLKLSSGSTLRVGTTDDGFKAKGSSYTVNYLEGTSGGTITVGTNIEGGQELVIDYSDEEAKSVTANVTANGENKLSITKKGTGTQTIAGTYDGNAINVQDGTLELQLSGAGKAGAVSVAADGELAVQNNTLTITGLSGDGDITGSGTLELTAESGSFGGNIATNFTYNAAAEELSKSFKLTGEFTGANLTVQKGTLEAALSSSAPSTEVTLANVTLAGGTLKVSEKLTVTALELTAGSGLDVQENLTVTGLTGSGSLTSLTLAAGKTLDVQAGGFTVNGEWSWGKDSAITLGTKGQKITLGESIAFASSNGENKLTFNLTRDYLEDAENGVTDFFGGSKWESGWENYFAFTVSGGAGDWKDLHLDENGKLAWTKKEGLQWNGGEDNTWSNTKQDEWQDAEGGGAAGESPEGSDVYFTGDGTTEGHDQVQIEGTVTPKDVYIQGGTYTFSGKGGADPDKLEATGKLTVADGAGLTLDVESLFKGVDLYGSLELDKSLTVDGEGKIKFLGGTLTYGADLEGAPDLSEKVATEDEGSEDAVKVAVSDSVTGGVTWGSDSATVGGEDGGNGGLTLALDQNGIEKSGKGDFTLAWQDAGTKHEGGIAVTEGNLALDVNGSTELSGSVTGNGTLKVTGGDVTLSGTNDVVGIEVGAGATLTAGSSEALGDEGTTLTLSGGTLAAEAGTTVQSGTVDVKKDSSIEGTVSLSGALTSEAGKKLTAGKEGKVASGTISGSLSGFKGTLDTEAEGSSWTLSGDALEGGVTVGVSGKGTIEFDGAATYSGKVEGSVTLASGEDGLTITSDDVSADAKLDTDKGDIVLGDKDKAATWSGKTVTGDGNLTLSHVELTNGKDMNLGGSTLNIDTTGDVSLGGMDMDDVTLGTVTVHAGDTVSNLQGTITAKEKEQFTLYIDKANVVGKSREGGTALFDAGRDGSLTLNVEKAEAFRLDFSNEGLMEYIRKILDGDQDVAIHIVENGTLNLDSGLWKEIEASAGGNWQLLKDLGMKITAVEGGDIILTGLDELKMYLVTKDGEHDPGYIGGEEDKDHPTGYGVLAERDATLLDADTTLTLTLTGTAGASDDATDEEKGYNDSEGGAIVHNLVGLEGSTFDVKNKDERDKKLVLDNTAPDEGKDQGDVPEWVDPRPIGQDTTFKGTINTDPGIDIDKTGAGTLTVGSESGTGGLLMGHEDTLSIVEGALKLRGDTNELGNVDLAYGDATEGEDRGLILDGGNATVYGKLSDEKVTATDDAAGVQVNGGGNLTLTDEANTLSKAGITGDGSGTITLAETTDEETEEVTGASLTLSGEDAQLDGVGVNLAGDKTTLDVGQGGGNVTSLNGSGTLKSNGGDDGNSGTLTVGGGSFSGTLAGAGEDGKGKAGTLAVADGASFTLDNASSTASGTDDADAWNVELGKGSELTVDVSRKDGQRDDGSSDKLVLGGVDLGNGKLTVDYGERGYSGDVVSGTITGAGADGVIDFRSSKALDTSQSFETGFTLDTSKYGSDADKNDFLEKHVKASGAAGFVYDFQWSVDKSGNIKVKAEEAKQNPFERTLPNMEKNSHAGAVMVWDSIKDKPSLQAFFDALLNQDSDYAKMINSLIGMLDSDSADHAELEKALASIAGSSISTLGPALSEDLHRQLTTIRNRTTTMANELRYDGYDEFPLVHAWINGEGAYRKLDADGFAPGYTVNSWGGTVGMDMDVAAGTTIGLALTAMYGDLKTDSADMGKGDMDTAYVSAFARTSSGPWTHTFIVSGGLADIKLNRTVNYGSGSYTTKGDTDGYAVGALYEIGYTKLMNEAGTLAMQPVINVEVRHAAVKGYKEKGSDAGLQVDDIDQTTVTLGVGARMQAALGANAWNRYSIFEGRVLLKTDLGDRSGTANNAIIGSKNFAEVESAEVGAVGIEIGAGLSIPLGADLGTFFLDGSVEWRTGQTSFDATAGYRISF